MLQNNTPANSAETAGPKDNEVYMQKLIELGQECDHIDTREKVSLPSDVNDWRYTVVYMPVTKDGFGPATIGIDADDVIFQVLDKVSFLTYGSYTNLQEALNRCIEMNIDHNNLV